MARHAGARESDPRQRRVLRWLVLAGVWAAGLAVGVYGLLSAAATFSCDSAARGLACRPLGTALGALSVVVVIAVVTAVTTAATAWPQARQLGRLALTVLLGLGCLAGCYFAARALLTTA